MNKAIPFANQIVCGLAVLVVVVLIAASVISGEGKNGGGHSNEMFFFTRHQDTKGFLMDYQYLLYLHFKNGVAKYYSYVDAKNAITVTALGFEYRTPKLMGEGTYKQTEDNITINITQDNGNELEWDGTIDENVGITLSNGLFFARVKSLQSKDMEGTYLWN